MKIQVSAVSQDLSCFGLWGKNMSLPHVILTVLNHRDATGYDITKEFSGAIGHVWKASHQQVYRELNKLAELGAVNYRLEPQDGKPDRKVYSITEIGKQNLYQWYLLSPKHPTERDEVSAKLLTCGIFDAAPMVAHLHSLIEESRNLLARYRVLEQENKEKITSQNRTDYLEHLALRRNILRTEAWLLWADEVLIALNAMEMTTMDSKVAS